MKKTLLVMLLALPACGAIDPSGYLIGAPVGITTADHATIAVKVPGFDPPDALHPFDALVTHILAGTGISVGQSPICAMSMGLEVLLITKVTLTDADELDGGTPPAAIEVAALEVGGHGWTAIGFTVDAAALGGDPLAGDVAITPEAKVQRTIFNYFLPRSQIEGVAMESSPRTAMRPEDLGLTTGDVIHGLDMHMALHHTDLAAYAYLFTERPLTDKPWVYFTLRSDFVTTFGTTLSTSWGVGVDAATIFMTNWDGTKWTKPTVYRNGSDLGLATSGLAVDALAIDAVKPGTISTGDEILFSLAGSHPSAPGPENQVLFASGPPLGGGPVPPPRRVVIRQPGAGFGSLGKQLGAGVRLGDICTGDPYGVWQREPKPRFLDEFLIGQRMPPPNPHGPAFLWPESKLGLSIAAYRRLAAYPGLGIKNPRLRTCMSWPRPLAAQGMATIVWGHVSNYAEYPGDQSNYKRLGSREIPYFGEPLVYEIDLPTDGVLRPAGAAAATGAGLTQAYYVQWFLMVDGERLRSPIAILRY